MQPLFHVSRLVRGILCVALAILAATACTDVEIYPPSSLAIAPDRIENVSLRYDTATSNVVMSWTAPRTNGGTERLVRYDIRFDHGDTLEWNTAQPAIDAPVPGSAGTREEYCFQAPERGYRLVAAIRSIDASGNVSPVSNVASAMVPGFELSGVVTGVLNGAGVSGLAVTLIDAYDKRAAHTGTDGRWSFQDLPQSQYVLRVESDPEAPTYFPVEDAFVLTTDTVVDFQMIPFGMSSVSPTMSLLEVFKLAVGVPGSDVVLRKWPSLPVDVYVPPFVNEHGLDYRALALDALERWVELTEVPLFRVVMQPPASGVTMAFKPLSEMGIQLGFTEHENLPDRTPLRSEVSIVNTFSDPLTLHIVMLHELGHTIRLWHLPAGFLMFGGQPLPGDPTGEEVWLVRVLHGMDDRTDLSIYREVDE